MGLGAKGGAIAQAIVVRFVERPHSISVARAGYPRGAGLVRDHQASLLAAPKWGEKIFDFQGASKGNFPLS